MSATDELRRLLDERGVEYEAERIDSSNYFTWGENDCYSYTEYPDGTVLRIWDCTPEQAIAATLGNSTLTADDVLNAVYKHGAHWQAIADELNATLGRGTCRSTTHDDAWCFACSECGKSFPRNELHLAHNHGEINYCPNCGARVERREQ